jgi:DNA-directed RNA polymerase subunit N (RpoN/RPB10)
MNCYLNGNDINSNFATYFSVLTEDGKKEEGIIQRVKEAKVMFDSKNQLLCSNNLILEMKKKLIRSCIWSVALYGSETCTLGKNEERVVNAFETWCWRRMLIRKWIDRITND